ncbi:MAG: hypothetical protein IPJ85_02515 [Flavobacteriales bacterium]|nr:hypothetical protein [Flavobacteriales bacterium]
MKKLLKNLLCGAALLLGATAATAQGLQNIIVEEFHTVTQADADAYNNNHGGGSYPLLAGMKTYRVYVDMAPNYRLASVFALPGQAVAFNTTTTFWNDDNYGGEFAAQTRRMDEGALFDTYVTFNVTGTAATPAGCGSALRQVGVARADDPNGDLTTCGVYPNFTGADGNIADPLNHPNPAFLGVVNTEGLTGQTNTFGFNDQLYYVLPAPTGPDPSGTNRILIGQFTTDGVFSFNINVALLLPSPSTAAEEYVHTNATGGQIFSSLLTYPSVCIPAQITGTTSNSPICSNQTLNLGVTATGTEPLAYTWTGTGSISNGGTANASVTGAATGNYNIAVSNACGNVNQNVAVVVNNPPNAGTNGTLTICAGSTVTAAQLFAQLGGTPDAGGSWSPALAGAGVYTYTVAAIAPCTGSATATVTVTAQPQPNAGTNGTLAICAGSTVAAAQLFAQLGGTPGAGGSWSPALAGAGVYTYTVAAIAPCTGSATSTVTVTAQPQPNAGTNGTLTISRRQHGYRRAALRAIAEHRTRAEAGALLSQVPVFTRTRLQPSRLARAAPLQRSR